MSSKGGIELATSNLRSRSGKRKDTVGRIGELKTRGAGNEGEDWNAVKKNRTCSASENAGSRKKKKILCSDKGRC